MMTCFTVRDLLISLCVVYNYSQYCHCYFKTVMIQNYALSLFHHMVLVFNWLLLLLTVMFYCLLLSLGVTAYL